MSSLSPFSSLPPSSSSSPSRPSSSSSSYRRRYRRPHCRSYRHVRRHRRPFRPHRSSLSSTTRRRQAHCGHGGETSLGQRRRRGPCPLLLPPRSFVLKRKNVRHHHLFSSSVAAPLHDKSMSWKDLVAYARFLCKAEGGYYRQKSNYLGYFFSSSR